MIQKLMFCIVLAASVCVAASKPVKPAKKKLTAAQSAAPAIKRESETEARYNWYFRPRAYPLGYIPAGLPAEGVREMNRLEAWRDFRRALGLHVDGIAANASTWTLIGASPDKTNGEKFPFSAGRVNAIVVDPRDANTVYAGVSAGGVWKTIDGGKNWKPLTDTQPLLAIGSMAQDKSHPDTVYAGTGDRRYGVSTYPGAGILKTTDAGNTWTQLPGPFQGVFGSNGGGAQIGSLSIHPTNSQILLAGVGANRASIAGAWRSTDGANSWTRVLTAGQVNTVVFAPDGNTAYSSVQGTGVFKSTDGGVTWNAAGGLPTTDLGRIELAMAPSNSQVLYAGVASAGGTSTLSGLFKSTDGGATWTQLTTAPDYCAEQCDYDNFVAVHPTNPAAVYVGGSDAMADGTSRKFFRSTDSGATWGEFSVGPNGVGIHPDVHTVAFSADASKLYVGHDGGMDSTLNPLGQIDWTNLNAGFATIQYYPGLSLNPTNPDIAFAGSQDNSTERYTGTLTWTEVTCGDGGQTAVDPLNPSTVYAACQQISINKSTRNGDPQTFQPAMNGIPAKERSEFIAPLTIDPTASSNLYFGTYRVWQTKDGASSWTAISPDLTGGDPGTVTALGVAPTDSNTVYAGSGTGKVWVTTNALAGASATWTERTGTLPGRSVTALVAGLKSPTTVYMTNSGYSGFNGDQQGHVFKSVNGGATWQDISTGLPNVPATDIAIDPDLAGTLYLATDVGVFVSTNDGTSWTPLGSGLPRVSVTSIRLHRTARILRIGTFGRSAWDLAVPLATGGGPVPAINAGGTLDGASFKAPVAPGSIAAVFGTNLGTALNQATAIPLPTSLSGTSMKFNGSIAVPFFFASPNQANIQIPWELQGSSSATLTATNANGTSTSATVPLAAFAPAIFSTNQQGTGQGVVTIANASTLVAPPGSIAGATTRAVAHGEFITIYCVGLGAVNNPPATGAATPDGSSTTKSPVSVLLNGVSLPAAFAGLSPGFVGLFQVNVQIPDNAPSGNAVTLALSVGGATSNTVTIAVQ